MTEITLVKNEYLCGKCETPLIVLKGVTEIKGVFKCSKCGEENKAHSFIKV